MATSTSCKDEDLLQLLLQSSIVGQQMLVTKQWKQRPSWYVQPSGDISTHSQFGRSIFLLSMSAMIQLVYYGIITNEQPSLCNYFRVVYICIQTIEPVTKQNRMAFDSYTRYILPARTSEEKLSVVKIQKYWCASCLTLSNSSRAYEMQTHQVSQCKDVNRVLAHAQPDTTLATQALRSLWLSMRNVMLPIST